MKKTWASLFIALNMMAINAYADSITLKDFSGVNVLPPDQQAKNLGIGWVRIDVPWAEIEKVRGQYDWATFDKRVQAAKDQNLQVLPILAYTPTWTRSIGRNKMSPPRDYEAWLNFVTAAVKHYGQSPYNIHYFQLWNEPTRKAKFWLGSDEDFIDKIYIPAAKIIRAQNAKVVFGGWPISNSLSEYEQSLDYHDAWKYTDVIDFHYGRFPYYDNLYNKYVATGKIKAIWQTELGYVRKPYYLSRVYINILHWALMHQNSNKDQYKLFWYPAWANGKDTDKALTTFGPDKKAIFTGHGQELATINAIFGSSPISAINVNNASLLQDSNAKFYGFTQGNSKTVIAVFTDSKLAQALKFTIPFNKKISNLKLLSSSGVEQKITYNKTNDGYVIQSSPAKDDYASYDDERVYYLVISS